MATANAWRVEDEHLVLSALHQDPDLVRTTPRVLVIEDDLALSTVIDRVLRELDPEVRVDWAVSAEEARAILRERVRREDSLRPYDLILADVFLDGEHTGLDFWRWCQREFPDLPLVVTSGLPVDRFFRALGPDEPSPPYLPKPFTVDECFDVLSGALRHGTAV
ncbi:MAG: hypothetical protein IT285_01460 [Bdellovibrionales bacterium]|nr:hypothetical protein [Bdellovibrionales bacterium]